MQVNIASSAESQSPPLVAAALQDHLSRQYSLSLDTNTTNANTLTGKSRRAIKPTQRHGSWGGALTQGTNGSVVGRGLPIRSGKIAVSASPHVHRNKGAKKMEIRRKGVYVHYVLLMQ